MSTKKLFGMRMLFFCSVFSFSKSSYLDADGISVENTSSWKESSRDCKKCPTNSRVTFIYLLQILKRYTIPLEHPITRSEYKFTNAIQVGSEVRFISVASLAY